MSPYSKLTPYPTYKPSGVEWLGDVPSHWQHRKLRSILHRTNERDRSDLPLLSVVRERGVIPRDITYSDDNHNVIPEDLSNYKVVHEGQFAMNKMKAWQGSYGVSPYTGIVSPAYFTFDIDGVTGEFLHVALRSKAYLPFFTAASDGVRIAQWDLSPEQMREIPLWIPPLSEQRAIARYLDYMDRRIQRYIKAKERLIELLEEQKRAVINQAVTRGLDPDVRLKASGVEWLGDVPAHWEVVKASRLFSVGSGTTPPTDRLDLYGGDMPWITTSELRETTIFETKKNVTDAALREFPALRIYPEDSVAVAMYGATIGRIGYLGVPAAVNQACCVFSNPKGMNNWYFFYWLQASRADLISLGYGGGQPNLSQELLKSLRVTKPPLKEQSAIVEFLDATTAKIEASISTAKRQIELIREYRTRLIADVVTGKLDVRDAAAGLGDAGSDDQVAESDGVLDDVGDDALAAEGVGATV